MTLGEVLARARTVPKIGDHEIVIGPDGLGHMVVVTHDENKDYRVPLEFMGVCPALRGTKRLEDLEVSPSITCLACMSW